MHNLTNEELKLVNQLGEIWNEFLALPEETRNERENFMDAIHACQRLILVRVGRRSLKELE